MRRRWQGRGQHLSFNFPRMEGGHGRDDGATRCGSGTRGGTGGCGVRGGAANDVDGRGMGSAAAPTAAAWEGRHTSFLALVLVMRDRERQTLARLIDFDS